jgi:hypothetical protein
MVRYKLPIPQSRNHDAGYQQPEPSSGFAPGTLKNTGGITASAG